MCLSMCLTVKRCHARVRLVSHVFKHVLSSFEFEPNTPSYHSLLEFTISLTQLERVKILMSVLRIKMSRDLLE